MAHERMTWQVEQASDASQAPSRLMPLRCARYRQLSPTAPATGKRLPSLSTYTMLTLPSRPRC